MNYTDAVDMANSVTRDIARWHLCEQYWEDYFSPSPF